MPPMVSEEEIEREYKTLRNLRRRSASSPGPGALPVDPDLPPPSPSSASTSSSSSPYTSNDDITLSTPDGLDANDPAGLFWVPAHLHPELAPGEFRAFLKAHTHADPDGDDAAAAQNGGLNRTPSMLGRSSSRGSTSGGGLGRKRSMLSRQYHPKAGDKVEEEAPPLPTLSRSSSQRASIYGGRSGEKGLTLEDLQKLEMLADEAALSEDPESMRRLLRRSLSMNVAPGYSDDQVSLTDDADAPIIVPRPGSILRRSARTKIRKTNLVGDGGGHRFALKRTGRDSAAPMHEPWSEPADEDDNGERRKSDESEERGSAESQTQQRREAGSDSHEEEEKFYDAPQHLEQRLSSDNSEESNIFDAYARNPSRSSSVSSSSVTPSDSPSPEGSPPGSHINLPVLAPIVTPKMDGAEWFSPGDKTPTQESVTDPMGGYRRPSPGTEGERRLSGPGPVMAEPMGMSLQIPSDNRYGPRPTSPTQARESVDLLPGMAPPVQRASIPPGIALQHQRSQENMTSVVLDRPPPLVRTDSAASNASAGSSKEKEKEKEKKGGFFSKKDKKDKDKDSKGKKDKDKFLGSLFSSKKKHEEPVAVASFAAAGPAAAAALLGSSKSAKSLGLGPPSPALSSPGASPFARYPIHVERAVYRLSHIKLANARRPLYEQVLISNLMFWYLGVIGRGGGTEEKKPSQPNGLSEEKKEEVKPVIKGTPPTPVASGSAARPGYVPPETVASNKKSSLTKPERSRSQRDHEVAMRPPQYGAQGAQVDKELRNANANGSMMGQQSQSTPQQMQRPPSQQQQQPSQQQPYPPLKNPQRAMSSPPPNRSVSPNPQSRPSSDNYPHQPSAVVHRELQGPPRGVPNSSFGPPPPSNQRPPPMDEPMRQRTLSQPSQGPPPLASPVSGGMRRVVTDGQPHPQQFYPSSPNMHRRPDGPGGPPPQGYPHPQHSGPQPGQVFQYPGGPQPGSPFPQRPQQLPPQGGKHGPQPGQIFSGSPQPGQVFQHPQYGPLVRPLPPPQQVGGGPLSPQSGPGRLPPGAGGPQWIPGPPPQGYNGVPPQLRRAVSPPGQGYDPRFRPGGSPYPGGTPPPREGGPPPQGFYQSRSPPPPGGSLQPGQIFNPYPPGVGPPGPGPGMGPGPGRQEDVYGRRQQVVPQAAQGSFGAHHR